MAIREKQDGEDKVEEAYNREFGGASIESLRRDGKTGKVTMPAGHASASPQYEAWDKPAIDGSAAAATAEHVIFRAKQACTIQSAHYIPDAALTADNTNFATITVKRRNADGTGAVTVASIATTIAAPGSGNWLQWVAVTLALTAANIKLTAGQILTVAITKASAGVAVQPGQLIVAYQLT